MKTGMEAETMDHDVVAPRRRTAEPMTEQSSERGDKDSPVLIRLPDLYPSARDDAAVARLATIGTSASPGSGAGRGKRGVTRPTPFSVISQIPLTDPASAPDVTDRHDTMPAATAGGWTTCAPASATVQQVGPSEQTAPPCAAKSITTGSRHMSGDTHMSGDNSQVTGTQSWVFPKVFLPIESPDLGTHVFRVLLVSLLIASVYLVFERTRRDGTDSRQSSAPATDRSWDGEGVAERRPEREREASSARLAAESQWEKPAAHVARLPEPERTSSARDAVPMAHDTNRPSEREERRGADSTAKLFSDREHSPDNAFRSEPFPAAEHRGGNNDVQPSTRSQDRGGRPAGEFDWGRPVQETSWDGAAAPSGASAQRPRPATQERYEPSWNGAGTQQMPPWNGASPQESYQQPWSSEDGHETYQRPWAASRAYNAPPTEEEYVPPYTPVTLRPRAEPQDAYPEFGNQPNRINQAPSNYSPPTNYVPHGGPNGTAHGWTTETMR